jgi:polar amino acid transport system permease protein
MIDIWIDAFPTLFDGLVLSLKVTGGSLALGLPLGVLLAVGNSAPNKGTRIPSLLVTELGRGAPALVFLQFFYFGLPESGLTLSSMAASIAGLTWTTAAYTSEMFRAGLQAVPEGEIEAADALGLTRLDTLRYILLPQGLRIAAPPVFGFSILIFQTTSLCFTIALPELLSRAYSIGSSSFEYFPLLTLAGLMYASITIPAGWCVEWLERRSSHHLKMTFT